MNLILDYTGFEDIFYRRKEDLELLGVQYLFKFKNGYGASVVKNIGSYGNIQDLWELAVIIFVDPDNTDEWELCYDTPITDYVIGWLTNKEVLETLQKIKELPDA